MKKIVDMDEFKVFIDENLAELDLKNSQDFGENLGLSFAQGWLRTQPDAEKKHGRWMQLTLDVWCCSACEHEIEVGDDSYPLRGSSLFYCPNCGARMDLGTQPDAEKKQQKAVTYKDVFFEAFPGARKDHRDGMPCFEACHIWPNADFKCDINDCGPCWSKEYPGDKYDDRQEMG